MDVFNIVSKGKLIMKPRNFPARKLARQIWAKEGRYLTPKEYEQARSKRSKKNRSNAR
jgi:hypothetical protein